MENSQLIQRYVWLFSGVLMYGMAVLAAITGKVRGRFGGLASRDEDRRKFWTSIAIYCLLGTGFLLFFLYKNHAFAN